MVAERKSGHDTFGCIFAALNPEEFENSFLE
jgi:hypothetical protein